MHAVRKSKLCLFCQSSASVGYSSYLIRRCPSICFDFLDQDLLSSEIEHSWPACLNPDTDWAPNFLVAMVSHLMFVPLNSSPQPRRFPSSSWNGFGRWWPWRYRPLHNVELTAVALDQGGMENRNTAHCHIEFGTGSTSSRNCSSLAENSSRLLLDHKTLNSHLLAHSSHLSDKLGCTPSVHLAILCLLLSSMLSPPSSSWPPSGPSSSTPSSSLYLMTTPSVQVVDQFLWSYWATIGVPLLPVAFAKPCRLRFVYLGNSLVKLDNWRQGTCRYRSETCLVCDRFLYFWCFSAAFAAWRVRFMSFDLAWTLQWNQRDSFLDDFEMKHLDLPFSFGVLQECSFAAASTWHHFCFPVLLFNQHLPAEIHTHSNGRRPFLSPFLCPIPFDKPDRFYPATAPASQLTTFHAFCPSADRSNPVSRSVSIGSWKGYF